MWLDAETTLAKLCVDGRVDGEAFGTELAATVRGAAESDGPVRAYGELVDLLWQRGDVEGAIALERLWNELIDELSFPLLCAYRSSDCADPDTEDALHQICRVHTSVSPTSSSPTRAGKAEHSPRVEATCRFDPTQDTPRAARQFLEYTLRDWAPVSALDDARLILSELVTNAVVHARSPLSIVVRAEGSLVHLAVHDESDSQPIVRTPEPMWCGGRGLHLVSKLARCWGVESRPGGKVVWAELPIPAFTASP